MDRFLCMYGMVKDLKIRPAISIAVSSPIDWNQFQLPLMNIFLMQLGCREIGVRSLIFNLDYVNQILI